MTRRQMRQYETLVRVHAFGRTYQDQFTEGGEARNAFTTIGAAIAEIDAFNTGKQTSRRLSRQTHGAARRALVEQLRRVARSARVLAKAVPDADARFPLPQMRSDVGLLQEGIAFAKEVAPMADAFRRCGLPATFAEDLQQTLTAFQQAIADRRAGRTGFTVSVVAIREALRRGMDAVDSLDVLVSNALGGDIKAMAAWKRDRRVDALPVRASFPVEEPPVPVTPVDGTPPPVAPALTPPAGASSVDSSPTDSPAGVAGDPPMRRAS